MTIRRRKKPPTSLGLQGSLVISQQRSCSGQRKRVEPCITRAARRRLGWRCGGGGGGCWRWRGNQESWMRNLSRRHNFRWMSSRVGVQALHPSFISGQPVSMPSRIWTVVVVAVDEAVHLVPSIVASQSFLVHVSTGPSTGWQALRPQLQWTLGLQWALPSSPRLPPCPAVGA